MANNGFEIQVPITIKGGREGEKVGKQIGEKIASQINKSFRAIGIGRTAGKTGGGGGLGDLAGMAGMTKGLKGVATKLGIIGIAAGAILGVLRQASPYLRGVLSIFGRAFMTFFRPFGDFLATLLRPLAIILMRAAVAFLRWTRSSKVGKGVVAGAVGAGAGALAGAAIGALGGPIGAGIGAIIGGLIGILSQVDWQAVGTAIKAFGSWALDTLSGFTGWVWEKITGIWTWTKDFGSWIWSKITGIWKWAWSFPQWIWDQIVKIWSWSWNFPLWLLEQLVKIWNWGWNFGEWLWGRITAAFNNIGSWLGGIGKYLYTKITDSIVKAFSGFKFGWSWFWSKGGGQVGIPNVPSDGMYKLHKGEEVVPRTKVGTGGRSVVLNPTFNISGGISKDIDVDSIARRASRMTEMELKKRGII